MASSKSIAFLGLGLMGSSMARRLVEKDQWNVIVWTRNHEKTKKFQSKYPKSQAASSPTEAISKGDTIIVMLTDGNSIKSTLLNEDSKKFLKNKVVIQISTIGSHENIQFAKEVEAQGGIYIECPVLGNTSAASEGTLQLLLSGSSHAIESQREILRVLGNLRVIGDQIGKSSVLKLALNQLIAAQMVSLATSISMVTSQDIPIEHFWDIVKNSLFMSKYFEAKFPKMNDREYSNVTFSIANLLKDVSLIEEELRTANLESSSVEGIKKVLENSVANGYGEDDIAAVIEGVFNHKKGN